MGKDKSGDKAGNEATRVKLPKRVAGVKIPKELRRRAEGLVAQARSEAGRAAILQGVSVVAGIAATAARAAAQSATAKAAEPDAAAAAPQPNGTSPGESMAQAVTAGIDAAFARLFPKR